MKTWMSLLCLVVCAVMHMLGKVESAPLQQSSLCSGLARYSVTFQGEWSKDRFPKMYPTYRPPAQWSKLVGRTHDEDYNLFAIGSQASAGLKQFAETGATAILDRDAQGSGGILDSFTAPKVVKGVGKSAVKVFVDAEHSKVSLGVKLIPSPDWFVGINSFELCSDGDWLPSTTIDLYPIDAGTDQGFTFTSPNWPSKPQDVVTEITSQFPNHDASAFFYPGLEELPRIGYLEFRLVTMYGEGTPAVQDEGPLGELVADMPEGPLNMINDAVEQDEVQLENAQAMTPSGANDDTEVTSLDCQVSEWGTWSPCSKTCGYGQKTRHRTVIQQPLNGGAACPQLSEETICGSMRSCKWKHFNFKFGAKSPAKSRRRLGNKNKRG